MMASKGAIVPVGEVMKTPACKFDPSVYMPAVAGYYTAPNGQMLSFPFNSSTTVFHYNKDAFKAAGLDPEQAAHHLARSGAGRRQAQGQRPQVPVHHQLAELDAAGELLGLAQRRVRHQAQRLRRPGRAPGLQHAAARAPHREPGQHGQAGPVRLQGPRQRGRRHLRLGRMRDDHRLVGAATAASSATPSSTGGIGTLPYYPDVPGAPQNTVIGGASLWVMSGKKPAEYKGVAQFFKYLSDPRCRPRATSAPATCRSPLAAFELTEKSGFYKQNPGTDVAREPDDPQDHRQVARHPPGQLRADPHHHRRGTRAGLGRQEDAPRRRWRPPSKRGNEQLERFEKANKFRAELRPALPPTELTNILGRRKARPLPVAGGCPGLLLAPQMAIMLVFFFWPAARRCSRACCSRTPSAPREWVGLENFRALFADETYLASFATTAVFSVLVAVLGLSMSLLLAVMADRVVKGSRLYRTLLIWPYAVAPAVAGVLWLFMFAPIDRRGQLRAAQARHRLEPPAQRHPRDDR